MKPLEFDKLPTTLRDLRQWLLWKWIIKAGKKDKLPFQVNGVAASSTAPEQWNTLNAVRLAYGDGSKWSGVGFVFQPEDGLCGIDLDGCRDPATGRVAEWAREIVLSFETYAEVSPSETGIKLFIFGKSPFDRGRKEPVPEVEIIGSKEPAIEVYDWGRYFAMTGWRLSGAVEPQERQAELDTLCSWAFPPEAKPVTPQRGLESEPQVCERARKYLAKLPEAIMGSKGSDRTFHAACVLMLGFGLQRGDALDILREWNAYACKPAWSDKELEHKIDDAAKQPGERNYLRNVKPEQLPAVRVPTYKLPEPKPEPKLTTLVDAAHQYVQRIRDGKTGLIELGLGDVDYAVGGGVEAGEIVVLAARPSHGKSAIALQCVHTWTANDKPCIIISEEMSALALGKRALQFFADVPQEHWPTSVDSLQAAIEFYRERHVKAIIAESCGTVDAAVEQIDKAVSEQGVKVAVVDYAQLLRAPGKTRYEQVTATSIALKACAARNKIVLLMLCQLSRSIENRNSFVPVMSDIKESGQLEQDADVIIFLVWPHRLDANKPAHEYQFFVAKNRNRAINQSFVQMRFLPSRQMVMPEKPKPVRERDPVFDDYNRGESF